MIASVSPEAEPQDFFRRDIDHRIVATRNAVAALRSGGTAMEVREAMIELGHCDVANLRTVRRDLWLLYRLGNVIFDESSDGVKFWRLANGTASRKNEP